MSNTRKPAAAEVDSELAKYLEKLILEASQVRLPELFQTSHPEALYQVHDRSGLSVVVLRTTGFTQTQLFRILKYRLGQYLHSAVGMLNARTIFEAGWEHEPLSEVNPGDLHVLVGAAETGELLCYAVLRALPELPPGANLRSQERPPFQVEKTHGWGIYNRLRMLPELPLEKVREMGRFIKNHGVHTLDDLGARAPVETGVALFRVISGHLHGEVSALVGDLEEEVAKHNLEYFHVPHVMIRGTCPYAAEESFAFPRYQYRTIFPFAALTADYEVALPRLAAIEEALETPGKEGLLKLFMLKRSSQVLRSSLEPPEGLAPLSEVELPQPELPMRQRHEMIAVGAQLRKTDIFSGLSVAEAAVLGTFMDRRPAEAGECIVRQGERDGDLYLIDSGEAEVRVHISAERQVKVATLGPGDYFGEIALLTAGERTADVVAMTSMNLMRLSKEAYTRYLTHAVEVEQQMSRTAASRASDTVRKVIAGTRV